MVRPDLIVICHEPEGDWVSRAPEMIVEVVSTNSDRRDESIKFGLYEAEGVAYYLLVYPDAKKPSRTDWSTGATGSWAITATSVPCSSVAMPIRAGCRGVLAAERIAARWWFSEKNRSARTSALSGSRPQRTLDDPKEPEESGQGTVGKQLRGPWFGSGPGRPGPGRSAGGCDSGPGGTPAPQSTVCSAVDRVMGCGCRRFEAPTEVVISRISANDLKTRGVAAIEAALST